jgi:ubiquinone/menaquinone biosynthesis C-methylase UbiE
LKENQHLLDLGCGTGWAVRYAASLVNNQGGFYGIDISPKMIEKAKSNSSDCKNVYFYQENAEQLHFDNDFFDFIICSNSFHHYFSPDKVLSEVYRVLKSKGRIYILDTTADGLIVRTVGKIRKKKDPTHVKLYSSREYKELFTKAKLNYIASQSIWGLYSIKIHIGEKP